MNGVCHKIGGLSAGIITTCSICPTISYSIIAVSILASEAGALIPDIDEPNSFVGKKVRFLSKGLKVVFGHRGIIHTPIFLGILLVGFYFLYSHIPISFQQYSILACINFAVGYISHLFLDMLTPAGIMVFYPFSKNRFRFMALKGDYRDLLVSIICLFILVSFIAIKYGFISVNVNAETLLNMLER